MCQSGISFHHVLYKVYMVILFRLQYHHYCKDKNRTWVPLRQILPQLEYQPQRRSAMEHYRSLRALHNFLLVQLIQGVLYFPLKVPSDRTSSVSGLTVSISSGLSAIIITRLRNGTGFRLSPRTPIPSWTNYKEWRG